MNSWFGGFEVFRHRLNTILLPEPFGLLFDFGFPALAFFFFLFEHPFDALLLLTITLLALSFFRFGLCSEACCLGLDFPLFHGVDGWRARRRITMLRRTMRGWFCSWRERNTKTSRYEWWSCCLLGADEGIAILAYSIHRWRTDIEHLPGRIEENVFDDGSTKQNDDLEPLGIFDIDAVHVWLVDRQLFPMLEHGNRDIWFFAFLSFCGLSRKIASDIFI
jgi:hypothetical protein